MFRDWFDALMPDEVKWTPYDVYRPLLPDICVDGEQLAYVPVPLIFFWIVEMYNLDRVMRQFGLAQMIPPPFRDTNRDLHAVMHARGGDWVERWHNYIYDWYDAWETATLAVHAPYNPGVHDNYMRWYTAAAA